MEPEDHKVPELQQLSGETQLTAFPNRYNTLTEVANLVQDIFEQEARFMLPRPLPVPIQGEALPHLVLRRNDKKLLLSLLINQVDVISALLAKEKERLLLRMGGQQVPIYPLNNHPLKQAISQVKEPAFFQINDFLSFIEKVLGQID